MSQICAKCGGSLNKNDRFCGECGTETTTTAIGPHVFIENGEVISEQDGVLSDIADQFAQLMDKSTPFDKIIIDVTETADFLQYFFADDILQLDFPITNPRQKELSATVFNFLTELDFLPFMAETTDNQKIMLCDLKGNPQVLADVSTKLAVDLFGINPSSQVKFTLMGPENPDRS